MTESQKRASAKYDKVNIRYYGLKLNKNTDADLINLLDRQENVQGFIKEKLRRITDDHN